MTAGFVFHKEGNHSYKMQYSDTEKYCRLDNAREMVCDAKDFDSAPMFLIKPGKGNGLTMAHINSNHTTSYCRPSGNDNVITCDMDTKRPLSNKFSYSAF